MLNLILNLAYDSEPDTLIYVESSRTILPNVLIKLKHQFVRKLSSNMTKNLLHVGH